MKFPQSFLLILAGVLILAAQTTSAVASLSGQVAATADSDYAAFQALAKEPPPGNPKDIGMEKFLTWLDGHRQAVKGAALAFYAAHPDDPRRWELVMAVMKAPPFFIQSFGPDVAQKGPGAIVPDEAAVAAWRTQAEELTRAMLASADAAPAYREDAEWGMFARDFRATTQAKNKGDAYDYVPFKARFDAHVAKYPDLGDTLVNRANDYLGALARNEPESARAGWAHLAADSPNETLKQAALKKQASAERMAKPVDLKFTAVDGREVDLAKLRGKVVLIDFWATWCGPCIAELPNVVANYKKYHDRGFEVVGIALENGQLAPKDTPEQTSAKLAKAKKVLTDFTAAHDMPWPQYFDGKWWKTDYAVQYDIQGIPAMFLLDQDGKIVSTEARGEKLEQEIKRLLKL